MFTLMNAKEVVNDVLVRLKESTSLTPYRLFLKVVDYAVVQQLKSPDSTVGYLNPYEANFRAVEADTTLAREVTYIIGYEVLLQEFQQGYELAMVDLGGSRPVLEAFHELVTEELTRVPPPNIRSLEDIDNAALLVAHLGYHYHLRFQHFVLTTAPGMASILEEDVRSSVECIVYLCNRLHIMEPGTVCHSKWETLKTTALQGLFDPTLRPRLDKLFVESSRLVAAELVGRVTWPLARVFVYLFATHLTATLVHNGIQLDPNNVIQYLDSADVIATVCPTDKYLASIDKTRQLLMKVLDGNLTADEMAELKTATIWQTRNFIYHFQPDTLPRIAISEIGTSPLIMSHLLSAGIDTTATSTVEQGGSQELADSEVFQGLKDTVMSLKEVVAAYPYRLFLKIMNRVATNDIGYPDGTIDSLNHHEMNICAVDVDTELARQLFSKMGYSHRPEVERVQYELVMLNVANHRVALTAFHEIAKEELRATVCPGIEELTVLDNIPLLVAHLAFNLHFRMSLLTFCTPPKSLDLLEEDIYAGMDCVEYLALRLDIMQPGDCRSAWYTAKQIVKKYVSSRGRNQQGVLSDLNEVYCDVSRQMDLELSLRVSRELVAVFSYAYSIQQTARVCISGEMLSIENMSSYLDSCDAMHPDCMSERWKDNTDRVRHLLLKSFDEALSRDEILKVAEIAIWQSRNFIYHFQPQVIGNEQSVGDQILSMRLRTVQRREDGTFEVNDAIEEASMGDRDTDDHVLLLSEDTQHDEKTDGHEKMDVEKEVHEKCDESLSGTGLLSVEQTCTDVESQEDGLLHSSHLRLAVLQQDINELQEALLGFDEAGAASAALNEAIREKKVEIDIVQRFISDLETMKCEIPGKVTVSGLGSLPQVCVAKMLQDVVDGARYQLDSQPCLVSLVYQIVHLISSVDVTELCRRLGLVACVEQPDMMEIIKERLTMEESR